MTTCTRDVCTSGSATVAVANGWVVVPYWMAWPALSPPITGVSFTEVAATVVPGSDTVAATPSLTAMVKVVVSVASGTTRLAVGVKTSARTAASACAAVPVKLHTPVAAS